MSDLIRFYNYYCEACEAYINDTTEEGIALYRQAEILRKKYKREIEKMLDN